MKREEELRNRIYDMLGRGDFVAAREAIQEFLSYDKIEALEWMVCLEIERKDGEAAGKELRRLLQTVKKRKTYYQSFLEARVLFLQDRKTEALCVLEQVQVQKAKPIYQEKIYNLMGQCYKFLGDSKRSIECYRLASEAAGFGELAALEYSNYLFNLHYLPVSILEQRKAAERYQGFFEKIKQLSHELHHWKKEKLRIGYISPDLRNHVVLRFSYALFSHYDHARFEVFLYANNAEDRCSKQLASMVDGWRNISHWNTEKAARLIHEDEIDILVDLAGHTQNNCLPVLAHKPAPIQISGIGYFASTGLKAVDYFLGDVHLDDAETEKGFTEELLLLPNSHFCYTAMGDEPAAEEPPCKKNGHIVFGSFNNFTKVNDEVLRAWGDILRDMPDAKLLLKAEVFDQQDTREHALRRIAQAGIPLERVEVRGRSKDYLMEYHDMDIALDTFPYPGGGTSCDALYMGIPVISLRGKSHGERFGASLLENVGLGELCADTVEDYVAKAVGLAREPELVEALHQNLRGMMLRSPLMDASLYMRTMEMAYEAVWERHVEEQRTLWAGQPMPRPFLHEIARHRHEKIRVGYLFPSFSFWGVTCFMPAFFSSFDSCVFDMYAYVMDRAMEGCMKPLRDEVIWRNLGGMRAEQAARQIYEDEIDILVDVSGREGGRIWSILEWKPAPIQVCGIGYATMANLPAMDYFIVDPYTERMEDLELAAEKLLRLPHSHLCYRPIPGMPSYIAPAPYRKAGHVTFACLQPLDKIADEMLRAWKLILEQVEDSVLLLKSNFVDDAAQKQEKVERLKRIGLPMERILQETPARERQDIYDIYPRIDILLDDGFRLDAGAVCDALYTGVPVIALRNRHHDGHVFHSLFANAGLEQFCADSYESYVERAVELAKDGKGLSELHLTLRWKLQQTPLMDAGWYMVELENAYGGIWCEWQRAREQNFAGMQEQAWNDVMKAHREKKQWDVASRKGAWLAWSKDSHPDGMMLTAFGYHKLDDAGRTLFWAQRAQETMGQALPAYLEAWAWNKLGYLSKADQICRKMLSPGMDMATELREQFWRTRAKIAFSSGQAEDASYCYWKSYQMTTSDSDKWGVYGSWLFTYNSQEIDAGDLFAKHKAYEGLFQGIHRYSHAGRSKHKKIRIGYISPDLCQHVMSYFVGAFLRYYDKEKFEVYVYNLTQKEDAHTRWLKADVTVWREAEHRKPELIARQVFEDEIDILFDLAGHTANSGLPVLAWKPAPVQISGLGYMATTGLSEVDYFLTDYFVDPVGEHEEYFVEKLLRIRSQFCYVNELNLYPPSPETPCRRRGWVLFGVFNGYRKFTDEMLLAWKEILSHVAESKILFKCQEFFSANMRMRVYRRLEQLGFDMDRIILEKSSKEYMERYLDVDIALDTYPYPGGGTTCDALFMGVPVVTRYGGRHSTRFSYSLLENIGAGDLAAETSQEYIEKAVALAHNEELLDDYHKNLRSRMQNTSVADPKKYMKEVEKQYQEIWNRYLGSKDENARIDADF